MAVRDSPEQKAAEGRPPPQAHERDGAGPTAPSVATVLGLQRSAGNQATAALLQSYRSAGASPPESPSAAPGAAGGPPQGFGTASEADQAAAIAELGGGGGGGPMRPSALGAGMATFAAAGQALQAQALAEGEQGMAGAQTPQGPAAEPPAPVLAPPPPVLPYVEPAAEPGAEAGGELDVGGTMSALVQHATGVQGDAAAAAGAADAQAGALEVGPLAPTHAAAPLTPPPAAARPLAPAPADVDAPLEPAVAQALDAGYSAELSTAAEAAGVEREAAAGDYRAMLEQAGASHAASVEASEAEAGAEVEATRAGASGQVEAHKATWRGENSGFVEALRAEVGGEHQAAAAEVGRQSQAANAAAAGVVSAAYRQAGAAAPAPPGSAPAVARTEAGETPAAAPATSSPAAAPATSSPAAAPATSSPAAALFAGALQAGADLLQAGTDALSDLASDARAMVEAALAQARTVLEAARRAVAERIARYAVVVLAAVTRVRDGLAAAATRAVAAIRSAVDAARAALDAIVARLRELGAQLLAVMRAAFDRAVEWLAERLAALAAQVLALGQRILGMADAVRQLLAVAANPLVRGLAGAVQDLAGFMEPFKARIGGWLELAPQASREHFDRLVGPLAAAPERSAATAAGGGVLQRTEVPGEDAAAPEPTHAEIAWEYVLMRLAYLGSFWPSVIGNILAEMIWPALPVIRHLPAMLVAVFRAWAALLTGRFSDWIDEALLACREMWAMLSIFIADFMVVAFIAGSILGTPILGEGAMLAIGVATLVADVVIGGVSIGKAWWNLSQAGRTDEDLNEDYSVIGDTVVSLGITSALLLIALAGQTLGKMLIARFPRVATALDEVRMRLRAAVGLRKAEPRLGVPNAPEPARPAVEFAVRADLTPLEQRAFDRFVAAQDPMADGLRTRLETATPDQVRQMIRGQVRSQPGIDEDIAQRGRAGETNASDPLRPTFANHADHGDGVTSHWNEVKPSEVPEAQRIAGYTDEPVDLFGDTYPVLDGTIGTQSSLRGLQIKTAPNTPDEAVTGSQTAYDKTAAGGYTGVETHVMAEQWTVAEVTAAFLKPATPGIVVDGFYVRAVKVWCKDGVYFPVPAASPPIPTTPVHPELGDEQPAAR